MNPAPISRLVHRWQTALMTNAMMNRWMRETIMVRGNRYSNCVPTCHSLRFPTMRALGDQMVEHEATRIHHEARVERAHRRLHARSLRHHRLRVVDRVQTLHSDLLHRHIGLVVDGRYRSSVPGTPTIFHIVRLHSLRRHQSGAHRVLRLRVIEAHRPDLAVEAERALDQRGQADAHHIGNKDEDQVDGLQSVDLSIEDEEDQTQERDQEEDRVAKEHHGTNLQRLLRNHRTDGRDQQGSHQTRSDGHGAERILTPRWNQYRHRCTHHREQS